MYSKASKVVLIDQTGKISVNKSKYLDIKKLLNEGYIAFFPLHQENENYIISTVFLPNNDISEQQEEYLREILLKVNDKEKKKEERKKKEEEERKKGKRRTEKEKKKKEKNYLLRIDRNGYVREIRITGQNNIVEELMNIIKTDRINNTIIINPDGEVKNGEDIKKGENAITLSQKGFIVLSCLRNIKKKEFRVELYLPISIIAKTAGNEPYKREIDIECITSILKKEFSRYEIFETKRRLTIYIGGVIIDNMPLNINSYIDLKILNSSEIIKATKNLLKNTKKILIDSEGRLIIGDDEDENVVKKGMILAEKIDTNKIYLPRATTYKQQKAIIELSKLCDFWQGDNGCEWSVYIDNQYCGKVNYEDYYKQESINSKLYGFLYCIMQYQKEFFNLADDALVVISSSGKKTTTGEVAETAFFGKNTAIKLSKNGCIVLIGEGATSAKEGYNNKLLYIPKDFGNNVQREQFEYLIKAFLRDNGKALKEGFTLRVFDSNGNEICALNQEEMDSNDIRLDIENGKGNRLSIIQNPNNNLYRFVIYNALGNVIYSIKKMNGNIEIFKHKAEESHTIFTSEIDIDDGVTLVLRNNGINEEYALDFIAKYVLCDLANDIQSDLMSYILTAVSERQSERETEGPSLI